MAEKPGTPSAAAAQLAAWLVSSGTRARALARAVGCTEGRISQILAGNGRPSPELAQAIERESQVPAASWFAVASSSGDANAA